MGEPERSRRNVPLLRRLLEEASLQQAEAFSRLSASSSASAVTPSFSHDDIGDSSNPSSGVVLPSLRGVGRGSGARLSGQATCGGETNLATVPKIPAVVLDPSAALQPLLVSRGRGRGCARRPVTDDPGPLGAVAKDVGIPRVSGPGKIACEARANPSQGKAAQLDSRVAIDPLTGTMKLLFPRGSHGRGHGVRPEVDEVRPLGAVGVLGQGRIDPKGQSDPERQLQAIVRHESDQAGLLAGRMQAMKLKEPVQRASEENAVEAGLADPTTVTANHLHLTILEDFGRFLYHVDFSPPVDDTRHKRWLLKKVLLLGRVRVFDGNSQVFIPQRLSKDHFVVKITDDKDEYAVTVKFIREETSTSNVVFYNLLFSKILRRFGYQRNPNGKHIDFSDANSVHLEREKLKISSGFFTSVGVKEGGLTLTVDPIFKVSHIQSALDVIQEIGEECNRTGAMDEMVEKVMLEMCGKIVMTPYNMHRTYRIDGVDFDSNANSTFTSAAGRVYTYTEYYREQYDLTIRNPQQPLLLTKTKNHQRETIIVKLVPELCLMTGLFTMKIGNDFVAMKRIARETKPAPQQRVDELVKFAKRVNINPDTRAILDDWGLKLDENFIEINAHVLKPPRIALGGGFVSEKANADWSGILATKGIAKPIPLARWVIVAPVRLKREVLGFATAIKAKGEQMGIPVSDPRIKFFPQAETASHYVDGINCVIHTEDQIVLSVMAVERLDIYASIKRYMYSNIRKASQCILAKNIRSQPRLGTIVMNILIQIMAKIGAVPWEVQIPMNIKCANEGVMFIGMDVFHQRGEPSYLAMAATKTEKLSEYYIKISVKRQDDELDGICREFIEDILDEWYKANHGYPKYVVVHRDGVGDGRIDTTIRLEADPMIRAANKYAEERGVAINVCFTMVSKRINTRILQQNRQRRMMNPPAGTVVDKVVTPVGRRNFFVTPQCARDGTTTPIHITVLRDVGKIPTYVLQFYTYALCHVYYNWPGAISVPATLQYAHKAANFSGEVMKSAPKDMNGLYFL